MLAPPLGREDERITMCVCVCVCVCVSGEGEAGYTHVMHMSKDYVTCILSSFANEGK